MISLKVLLCGLISPIFAEDACLDGQCAVEEMSALQMEQRLHVIERESAFVQELMAYESQGIKTNWTVDDNSTAVLGVYIAGPNAADYNNTKPTMIIVSLRDTMAPRTGLGETSAMYCGAAMRPRPVPAP